MAMFQGTVLDAETIYLGIKIEEGFKAVAAAMGDQSVNMQLNELRNTIALADPRGTIRTLRDRQESDASLLRKELAALTKALTQKEPETISEGETPA